MSAARFRTAFERGLVAQARARGWVVEGRSATGHLLVVWPATGHRQPLPGKGGGKREVNIMGQLARAERGLVAGLGRSREDQG